MSVKGEGVATKNTIKRSFLSGREFTPNWRADIIHTECLYFKHFTLGNWLSHEVLLLGGTWFSFPLNLGFCRSLHLDLCARCLLAFSPSPSTFLSSIKVTFFCSIVSAWHYWFWTVKLTYVVQNSKHVSVRKKTAANGNSAEGASSLFAWTSTL